jgi:hypothetical protein
METSLGNKLYNHNNMSVLGSRDAIHIATLIVVAGEPLLPNQDIGVDKDNIATVKDPIGRVDPFLKDTIYKGDIFYMILYPNTVSGMKHHWKHPKLDVLPPNPKEFPIIKYIADKCGKTVECLMEDSMGFVEYEDYVYDNSERYKDITSEEWLAFWDAFEIITQKTVGVNVLGDHRYGVAPYTCSC